MSKKEGTNALVKAAVKGVSALFLLGVSVFLGKEAEKDAKKSNGFFNSKK